MSEEENWGDYVEDSEGEADNQDDGQNQLEDIFYSAEELKDSNPKGAMEQYMLLLDSEEPLTEKAWSAKCINEIITLKIKKQDVGDMNQVVKKLLTYINSMSKYDRGVTIDCIFTAVNRIQDVPKKKETFEILLTFLREKEMTLIWMSTSLKLARIYLAAGELAKFEETIAELERCKELANFEEVKGNIKTLNLYSEIVAMKIEKMLSTRDLAGLKRLVDQSKRIKLAEHSSSDIKILSVLMEAEGVICILEKNWEEAETCLKKAFQFYHEVGHQKTKDMLILNSVANILSGMSISPFSSPEAQMFLKDDTVVPFNVLWNANFEKNHLEYLSVLETECSTDLLKGLDLLTELRKAILYGFLKKIIVSYKTLSLDYLSKELQVSRPVILQILLEMILDKQITGLIDELAAVYTNTTLGRDPSDAKHLRMLEAASQMTLEVAGKNLRVSIPGL